jgi:SAM-dependent methyltransferase
MAPPSPFFVQQTSRLSSAAERGPVVDLACGRGRHCIAAAEGGAHAIGVDRNPAFLAELRAAARRRGLRVDTVRADLESHEKIPLNPECCAVILVFRFLFRPLAPRIEEALQPGGLLLFETFTVQQRQFAAGPRNPAFLLDEGELPKLFPGLEVLEFWEGVTDGPTPAAVARLAARKLV